jgi:hypothetical protein
VGAGLHSERMQQDAQGMQGGALTHNNKNKISLSGDQPPDAPTPLQVVCVSVIVRWCVYVLVRVLVLLVLLVIL